MEPKRVTANQESNDQLLYFTSNSLTADDGKLVFISDRNGHPNLYCLDLASGQETALTANTEGVLKTYVYFDGQTNRGFGKASVSLDSERGLAYFIQGRDICVTDLQGQVRVLTQYPADQVTAFTHVSADGRRLCVPTTDARALDDDLIRAGNLGQTIDQRVQKEGLSSYLRVYDTESGEEILCEEVPKAWVTHVQFSPLDSDLILYNHEWPADCGIRRMWLWDGQRHLRLRPEGEGRSRADWTCHEMWERDGSAIIYHGNYAGGRAYLGRVKPDGSEQIEIALPEGWHRYGHFTVGRPNELVSDGYYEAPNDDPRRQRPVGQWICRVSVDWAAETIDWQPLCRNGSSWDSQDSHPHPVFNHAADTVYFTSDMDGRRAVYSVEPPRSFYDQT